jgi:hypothetical protein
VMFSTSDRIVGVNSDIFGILGMPANIVVTVASVGMCQASTFSSLQHAKSLRPGPCDPGTPPIRRNGRGGPGLPWSHGPGNKMTYEASPLRKGEQSEDGRPGHPCRLVESSWYRRSTWQPCALAVLSGGFIP